MKKALRIFAYPALGGVVAFAIGYFLSAGLAAISSTTLSGVTGGPEAANAIRKSLFAISGLNFMAFHTVSITGTGSGERLLIHLPVTLLTLIPVISLMIGGYIATKPIRPANPWDCALMGALIAPFYMLIALILRPHFAIDTAPYLGLQVMDFQNPLPAMVVGPAFGSTIRLTAVFAFVFGAIGGMKAGLREGLWRGLLIRPTMLPAWLRGALIAFVTIQIALTALFFVLGVGSASVRRNSLARHGLYQPAVIIGTVAAPEAAAVTSYFFQGAQIDAGSSTSVAESGMTTKVTAGIFTGARERTTSKLVEERTEVRKRHVSPFAYVGLLFAAIVFVFAGQTAARTAAPRKNPLLLGVQIAFAYTVMIYALAGLYAASITRSWKVPAGVGKSVVGFSFTPWTLAVFPLVIALVFTLLGTLTAPRREGFRG